MGRTITEVLTLSANKEKVGAYEANHILSKLEPVEQMRTDARLNPFSMALTLPLLICTQVL